MSHWTSTRLSKPTPARMWRPCANGLGAAEPGGVMERNGICRVMHHALSGPTTGE